MGERRYHADFAWQVTTASAEASLARAATLAVPILAAVQERRSALAGTDVAASSDSMSISAINQSLSPLTLLSSVSTTSQRTSGIDTGGSGGASASVSTLAQYLSGLQQLQQANPAQLKTVLTDIANKLQAAAQAEGGSAGQALSHLANRFQQAAQTGDVSALRPAHHHHGHHHHGAVGYQQASGQGLAAQSGSSAADVRSQALDIIGQVIGQDLGSAGTTR
jgi:hypothetical protein